MAPTDDFLIERPADGTAVVVVFSGEDDLASAPEVRTLLESLLRRGEALRREAK